MPTPMTTGPEPAPAPQGFAPMPPDPYTTEARLCDDAGLISDEAIPGLPTGFAQPPLTWRQRLNNLRAHTGLKPYDGAPVVCTGSAHLAREHIRCTSPAHLGTPPPPVRTVALRALNRSAPRPHDGELGDARVWSRRRGGDTSQTVSRRGRDGAGSVTVAGVDLTPDEAQAYAEDILAAVADAQFRFSGYQQERGEAAGR